MPGAALRSLERRDVEALLHEIVRSGDPRIDLSGLGFVDPYGLLSLLVLGEAFLREVGQRIPLRLPQSAEVLSYLVRMNFPARGHACFESTGPRIPSRVPRADESPVLLEITPVETSDDVQGIVRQIQERLDRILTTQLGYTPKQVHRFAVAVSEICQNIPDHAQAPGLVAIQRYRYVKRLGGLNLVKIAVADGGIGIRTSLTPRYGGRHPQAWDDLQALTTAFERGVSRVEDIGRGHGLKRVREMVRDWGGNFLVRSGTAAVEYRGGTARRHTQRDLVLMPGTQILIELPQTQTPAPA